MIGLLFNTCFNSVLLMPKTGILDRLNQQQREQLLTWLEIHPKKEVLERLAAPPPEGFGLRTHYASLRRFEQQACLDTRADDLRLAQALGHSPDDLHLLKHGAAASLARAALHWCASLDPLRVSAGAKVLAALNRDDFRAQHLALLQQRLDLDRQRLAALLTLKEAQLDHDLAEPLVRQLIDRVLNQPQPPVPVEPPSSPLPSPPNSDRANPTEPES